MRISGWLYLIEQALCSCCLLCAIGLCAGVRRPCLWRIALISAFLSAGTLAAQSLNVLARMLLLLPVTAFSPLLAYPDVPRRLHLRMAAAGIALSIWLTGVMRLISPLMLPGTLQLLLGCALLAFFAHISSRTTAPPRCISVELRLGLRQTALTALVDSGNLLRDAVTGLPVIVISRRAASRLMALPSGDALLPGMRLMNVRTISGTALMTILRPDSVRILTGGEWQEAQALIGLSPDGYDGFQALVPACLVSGTPTALPRKAISQGG